MADAERFPHLALPFAVVGAAAGWLCSSMIVNVAVGFQDGSGGARFMPYQLTCTAETALGGALMGDPGPRRRGGDAPGAARLARARA